MTKINKEGWEIKKLGEVATIVSGATPKTNIPEYWGEGHFWITPAEIKEGDIEISKTERTITDEAVAHTNVNLLPEGTVLLSSRAPIGKVAIASVPMYCNQGFKNCVCKESLHNKFLFYFLRCKNELLQSLGRGATFKEISKSIVEGIKIPLPPLPFQQRIVEELDEINAIISAKKQQLQKLDELAQSIFYNMFGDPVANEKGWEVHQLGVVSPLLNGRAYKQNELLDKGKYKVLRVGNFFTNGNYYYSDLELPEDKYCDNGDLLFAWSASFGARIWDGEKVIYHYHIWKVNYDTSLINKWFYLYLLNTLTSALMNDAHGIGMIHLTKGGMEEKQIPLPPLPLQETFATRVSAIEEEKAAITASIEKMQTLLDARMQEYFG